MVSTRLRTPSRQMLAPEYLLLTLIWCFGVLMGTMYAQSLKQAFIDVFCVPFSAHLSFVGFLSPTVLPFLLSAFAVYFSKPKLLYCLCGFKAFSYAFCNYGISMALGPGNWLFRLLYMFSDFLGMPLLFCFWSRHTSGTKASLCESIWVLSIFLFLSGVDYFHVTPYLLNLLIS